MRVFRIAAALALPAAAVLAMSAADSGRAQGAPAVEQAVEKPGMDGPAGADADAGAAAGRAAAATTGLEAARARLEAARQTDGASAGGLPNAEFIRALRDLEAALAMLRDGIAGAEGELRTIAHGFRRDDPEIKRLVAALISAARTNADAGGAMPRLHPGGIDAAARAAAMLTVAETALSAGGDELSSRLAAREAAKRLRQEGEVTLAAGLADAATARTRFEAAARERALSGPPDPESAAARAASESGSLGELAKAVATRRSPDAEATASAAVARLASLGAGSDATVVRSTRSAGDLDAGVLEQPVTGRIRLGFREIDGGGVQRPGLTFAAAPRAVVASPAAGEVRYAGPFLDWQGVVIIDTDHGDTAVLAGLEWVVVEAGERLGAGDLVGLLGGRALDAQEFLMLPAQGSDAIGEETLYMELWRAGEPVDPAPDMGRGGAAQNG